MFGNNICFWSSCSLCSQIRSGVLKLVPLSVVFMLIKPKKPYMFGLPFHVSVLYILYILKLAPCMLILLPCSTSI